MRVAFAILLLVACACGGTDAAAPENDAPMAAAIGDAGFQEVPAPYGADVHSLRVKRSIVVRAGPDPEAPALGTVAQDMRVEWRRAAAGPECSTWIEILPRGWVCEAYLEPNPRPPRALEMPRLPEGDIVPGVYARVGPRTRAFPSIEALLRRGERRVIRDAELVRRVKEVSVRRRRYWRTERGELIPVKRLQLREPSSFSGVDLTAAGAPLLPFAWATPGRGSEAVPVWEEPMRWVELEALPERTIVPVLGTSKDGEMVRIGRRRWAPAAELRVARLAQPPPEAAPNERWIDIDLDEQTLVAYEGVKPAYATLVSTGRAGGTPTGTWRIWIKLAEADMKGAVEGRPYSVDAVPWTMFFQGDFALHAAYWHNRFGEAASSGCVNLAPVDARALYQWSEPEVPLGWSMAYATPDRPGSLVRIRSRALEAVSARSP